MRLAKIASLAKQTLKKTAIGTTALVIGLSGLSVAAPLFLTSGTAYAAGNIDITNVTELRNAIENQADGQTWTIEAGNYGLTPFTDITAEGQTGWYFPITASNLTINGVGNPTIYGTDYTANGAWSTQNLITIVGNNDTINGLTLMPKVEPNKTIEVLGSDSTIENTTIEPNTLTDQTEYNNLSDQTEKDWGGSIYYNNTSGTHTLSNVTVVNGGISDHSPSATLSFSNVNLKYTTSTDWINSYRFASHGNPTVGSPQVTYQISSAANNLNDVLTNAQDGDIIQLGSNLTTSQQITLSKAVTLDGNGYTISPNFTKSSNDNNAAIGIQANNVTVKNLTEDGTNGTNLHGVNVYEATGVNLDTVTIKNNGHAALIVNGSSVTATNLDTSNNTWGAVNVDPGSGVTAPSIFTLNSGTLSESNQIWSDGSHVNTSTGATVSVTAPSGYGHYKISDTGYDVWTNNLTNVASITNNSTSTYYSTIQAAVNAASSGDTIKAAPGTYSETVSISKPLTLQGAQANVAAASTAGSQRSGSESTVSEFNITSSNVTINGFSLNNSGTQINITSATTLSGINIENNVFKGYSSVGIPTYDAGNLTIQNNYFTSPASNSEPMQIKASSVQGGCDGTTVKNNVFDFATNNGSADVNFSCTGSNSSNITVSGNHDLGNTGGTSFVSFAGVSDGINVSQNVVTGMSGSAIFFWGGVTGNVTISNNSIKNGSSNAVSIQDMGASYGANTGTFNISNNDLSGNNFGVKTGSGALSGSGSVSATQNYWGDNIDPSTQVSGGVSYKPYYLDSGKTNPSNQSTLTSLSLSSGTLSPSFSSGTTSYSATVANSVTSVSASYTASSGANVSVSGGSNLAVGNNTVTVTVTSADGTATKTYTVTVNRAAATQTLPSSDGSATVTSSTPQVVVTSTSQPVTITVSSGTTNASIDYSSLKTSSTTAVIPQTTINTQNANVQIQSNTTITASDSSWNGVVNAPTVQTATSVSIPTPTGQSTIVGTVIDVGADNGISLTFDKAVRLLIPDQAGQLVGFVRGGNFTQITDVCSADSQDAGNALSAGGNCYINVGNDMAVWTKHFTQFVTYEKSNTYTVQPGDTMYSIAVKLGLTLAKLEALNPQAGHPAGNFSLILPGDVLKIGGAIVPASANLSNTGSSASSGVLGNSTSTPNTATSSTSVTRPAVAAAATAKKSGKILGMQWYFWLIALAALAVAAYSANYIRTTTTTSKKK